MDAKTFNQLKTVIGFLWQSKNPFYRNFWQKTGFAPEKLQTPSDFQLVPSISRQDIIQAQKGDPLALLYGEEKDIAYVRTTGATTSQTTTTNFHPETGLIFSLQTQRAFNRNEPYYKKNPQPPERILILEHSRRILTEFFEAQSWLTAGGFPVVGDILDLRRTATIASQMKIDGFMAPSGALLLLLPFLEESNFPRQETKFIRVIAATRPELQALRLFFPKALIYVGYGLSEFDGGVGFNCQEFARGDFVSGAAYYHPRFRVWIEVVHPETGQGLADGQQGELVISHLDSHSPFPLIRYRTGDRGIISDSSCPCGLASREFRFLGRINQDVIRASGAILTMSGISRAIADMQDLVHGKFSIKISQARRDWRVTCQIELSVLPRDEALDPQVISTRFSQLLQISPRFTLEEAIKTEAFATPVIRFLTPEEYRTLQKPQLVNGLEYS